MRVGGRGGGWLGEQVKLYASLHLSSNGNLDLDTGLNVDNDLLDDLGGGSQAVIVGLLVSLHIMFPFLLSRRERLRGRL